MNNFLLSDGEDLSAYALACGYIQRKVAGQMTIELYREHMVYHVRAIPNGGKWLKWRTFDTLKEARQVFAKFVREELILDD